MTIPFVNFQPQTTSPFAEGLKGLSQGLQQGVGLYNLKQQAKLAKLQQQAQSMKNQYLPQQLQQALAAQQAQTGLTQQKTKFIPTQYEQSGRRLDLQEQQQKQMKQRFGPAYQILKFASTPAGRAMMAGNANLSQSVMRVANNQATTADYSTIQTAMQAQGGQQQMQPGMAQPGAPMQPGMAQPGAPMQPGMAQGGQPQMQPGAPQGGQPIGTPTPGQVGDFQDTMQSLSIKGSTPAQQLNQRVYAVTVDNMMNEQEKNMPDITSFSGLLGKAKQAGEGALSSLGVYTAPEYKKFMNFANAASGLIGNDVRRALGGQATDNEQRLMDKLSNPNNWFKNPALALSQWKQLRKSLKENIKGLSMSTAQIQAQTRQLAGDNSQPADSQPGRSINDYSDEELLAMKRAHQSNRGAA